MKVIEMMAIQIFVLIIGMTTIYSLLKMVNEVGHQAQLLAWITLLFTLLLTYIQIILPSLLLRTIHQGGN